jgi:hypothetical protein
VRGSVEEVAEDDGEEAGEKESALSRGCQRHGLRSMA